MEASKYVAVVVLGLGLPKQMTGFTQMKLWRSHASGLLKCQWSVYSMSVIKFMPLPLVHNACITFYSFPITICSGQMLISVFSDTFSIKAKGWNYNIFFKLHKITQNLSLKSGFWYSKN
jgi:hypothetical protein